MNLIDSIIQSAFRYLGAPAFVSNHGVITYRTFYSLLCAVARAMHEQGVRPGDTVGLSMEQSHLHCVAVLALARLGAISVPVHPELARPLRERIVARYGVRTMVSLNGVHDIAGVKSIRLDEVEAGTGELDMGFTAYVPNGATPLRISLTSGTTGDPDGDMLTHGQLLYRVERTLYGCDCDCNSRVMPSDINSAMGLALAIGMLKIGGTVVFPNSYLSRDRMEAMNLHAVTHAFLSPWATSQMLAFLPNNGIAFPVLRHLRLAGSAPSEALLDALRSRFTPHVFVTYGLTEIGPISTATPEILAVQPRSSGEILPWVQLDVVDENGEILPPGRPGEIRVKVAGGPTEYYADAQKTARKFRDGWFYTGDCGRVTEEGLLFVEGRMDEIINLGGYKVNPAYVEKVLARHPHVAEAVVFAMSDGTVSLLAAALIPRVAQIDVDDVVSYAKQQLGWGQPKRFFVVRDFPRTPNGKVIRAEVTAALLRMPKDREPGSPSYCAD